MADDLHIPKTGRRDYPERTKRKALTRAQLIEIVQRQSGNAVLCGCGCGKPLKPKCIDEHVFPRAALESEFADRLDNRALYLPECAKKKTPKDQGIVAKTRHLKGISGQRARWERRSSPLLKSNPEIKGPPVSALSSKSAGYRKQKWAKKLKLYSQTTG